MMLRKVQFLTVTFLTFNCKAMYLLRNVLK